MRTTKQLRRSYSVRLGSMEGIDAIDSDEKYYIKRKSDLDDRPYKMYDKIEDVVTLLNEVQVTKTAIETERLIADHIYKE